MVDVPAPAHRRSVLAHVAARPLAVDALIAAGLTAVALVTIAGGARDFGRLDPLGVALILLQTLPLVARRIAPVPVFVVTMSALVAQAMLAGESFSSSLGALVALFTVAERCERRTGILAAGAAALGITLVLLVRVGLPAGLSGLTQSLLTVLVVWLVGTWSQERARYIGTVEERAMRAEAEREQRAIVAVAAERERIARELHDVVTHHVSVIVIQAGAALRSLDTRPDDARSAIEAIDASARQALGDMRRMLGILGPPTGHGAEEDPARSPMPGLDRVGELVEQVRAAGSRVELSVQGDTRALDPGVELSAYRIVQEALTNALKHAAGARTTVALRYEPDALEVEVVDDGGDGARGTAAGSRPPGHEHEPGRGLIGMRERAALFGGTLEAGPVGPGFRVLARLPLDVSGTGRPPVPATR